MNRIHIGKEATHVPVEGVRMAAKHFHFARLDVELRDYAIAGHTIPEGMVASILKDIYAAITE